MLDCFSKKEWFEENNLYQMKNLSNENNKTAFSDVAQEMLYKIEANSWWFVYRAQVILVLMERFFCKERRVLDIGGGNGYTTLQAHQSGYSVALIEPSYAACVNAKKRGLESYCGVVSDESINNSTMEQVLLLDVLEHIEYDTDFLQLLYNKMCDDGVLLLTVPAMKCLWSSEDDYAGHFKRYEIKELEELAKSVGFSIEYSNYFMQFCFFPIYFVRVLGEKIGMIKRQENRTEKERERIEKKQFQVHNKIIDKILKWFEMRERRKLQKQKRIRYGSSIVLVLKKVKVAKK